MAIHVLTCHMPGWFLEVFDVEIVLQHRMESKPCNSRDCPNEHARRTLRYIFSEAKFPSGLS